MLGKLLCTSASLDIDACTIGIKCDLIPMSEYLIFKLRFKYIRILHHYMNCKFLCLLICFEVKFAITQLGYSIFVMEIYLRLCFWDFIKLIYLLTFIIGFCGNK